MEKTIKYLENGEYHYATVRSVGDLAELKTNSKETLVEAINELWDGGGNSDPSKAPKPEGYDQLVEDVADAVKNQQEISQQWTEWQKEDAQLTEERKQAYLQAMKEMQEAVDKAKADAAALDDKTSKLDEQITKTFSELDTNIQNMHEQLQKEADRMNQELINTKSDLTRVRTDLQNTQMDNGKIHDELTNINGKFEHKVWQTDLDPLKEQIDRAETSVQQTKDELLGKASREDLDTVTNAVSKLDTQLKETAKGVEISVKKDELGGEIAEALINKTNILLGTRRFTTNNWTQRDHVEICSDPWKGFLVAKQNSPIEGIQQAYDVKAGTTYTFSLFAKMDNLDDSNKPQITLAQNNLDTSLDTKIDVWRKDIDDITSDFKRYDLTFTPSEDCTIYPHVISNSNNPIFVCGYQLEIGKELTPWEPNQEDVGDYVEKSEAQLNVYNDKIQALTEKQRQQGDTQEQLRTEVTQTAEGVKQVSESLKNTNGDITKLRGDLERTADHMKSEYESYTNKAVGQISDSTLNLIRNSSFQNKDEDFAQWQNISAKANVRSDENGLRWVELTQSGLTTDNPQGITSNYFNVKQGKVTVAVDIKAGDKATLDNESVLFLELYNDAKKRVDFRFVTLSELGLSKNLLDDHKVHRGLYRLGIDRNDAKYMTVKAHLMRNGDLYFTNFSARLSSIDDGAYEPNPDDLNQQILKQNTKIEQNAKEVAIKANSVDVTRDIKSAVDGIRVGGRNLANGTDKEYTMGYGIPNTTWQNGYAYLKLPSNTINNEILPQDPHTFYYTLTKGTTYTQTIWFETDAKLINSNGIQITWFTNAGHDGQSATLIKLGENKYKLYSTYTWPGKSDDSVRLFDTFYLQDAFNLSTGTYIKFGKLKLEEGNVSTDWTPSLQDTSEEIKSAKDAAIQVASDQINIHVNELSTSFDDKLNKRVNEVKTASEKFTSDGIELTVKKITDVKNQVDGVNDRVNNLKVGGRNLVRNTDTDIVIDDTGNTGTQGWHFATINLTQQPKVGDQITVSAEATLTGQGDLSTYDVILYNQAVGSARSNSKRLSSGKRASATLQVNNLDGNGDTVLLIYAGNISDTEGKKNVVHHLKVEFGNVATDWTPAPEDTSEEIKSAKEAAIKVSSDKIDLQVQEITGKFNDKLNKSAVEIKSASEKFTTDGIEQTVTKITNVKNDVDRLGDTVNSIGSRNLLHNTSDRYKTLTGNNYLGQSTASDIYTSTANYHGGDWFTYAATITNNSSKNVTLETWLFDQNKRGLDANSIAPIQLATHSADVYPGEKDKRVSTSFQISGTTWFIRTYVIFDGGGAPNGSQVQVKDERLVEGRLSGDWSPNPEDINKKIDTQTLDSANIDDLKTQGHYFVRNLTGNPIGGWVYVDVTGNNNDRIRQDVYQDNGGKHMCRRLFGNSWSGWEQGAYISDVNAAKTEVTASVKNLGDRVTTEVSSVETRVTDKINGLGGGRNFVRGTSSGWSDWSGFNGTSNQCKDIGQLYWNGLNIGDWVTFHVHYQYQSITGNSAVIMVQGSGNTTGWNGGTIGSGGNHKLIASNSLNFGQFDFKFQVTADMLKNSYHTIQFRVDNAKNGWLQWAEVKAERGVVRTPWSPAPEDTAEAIKTLNTKWDVANGQIQGKVTATDVNNILNGKGYATQSWAQTMFQMKSDSITLQAVRDNITNGIQNQVNDTRNQLNNMQVGGQNYLQESNKSITGWAQDLGTLPNEALNSLAGKTITVSVDVEWNNFTSDSSKQNRLGFELAVSGSDGKSYWLGAWKNPTASNGKERISMQYTLPDGVTFTVNNNSANGYVSINGTGKVSHAKIEVGNVATDWSPNPNDTGNGVNVLRGTADFSWPTGIGTNGTVNLGYEKFDATTIQLHVWGNNGGIYTKWGEAFPDGQIQVGEQYVFSFDIKGNGTFSSVKNESESLNIASGVPVTNTYQRVKVVGTIKSLDKAFIIYFQGDYDVRIKNVKIERGSKATPWTPHPFDDKDKGVNLLKSTAYWNPNDWNHISDGHWYDDNWTDNLGHKAYGRSNAAWDGLGQTVYVTPGVYTWSAQIYLNGLDSNDSVYPYMGDSQYNGTAQVQEIRRPMLGVNDQNRWIDYSTTFYVKNAGNLCVRPELNRDHGTIHVGSQKLEHGMVATPWSPSPLDDKNATITLDSADINSMKTQGHYFVRNLANSPIAGWVYVDVTGNNNDRLKQEVYQDNGYEHRSRRWTGSGWTEWTTDVNNKNVVSQINITPENIRIASNKIVIDGNTDIHGDLRTDRVRLVGKQGLIDMTGDDGMRMANKNGSSILIGNGNIDLMYNNDFRMNIDSSMMTLLKKESSLGQNNPIAIGSIGTSFYANDKRRGMQILYTPGKDDWSYRGADYLGIGYSLENQGAQGQRKIYDQLELYRQDTTINGHLKRKGIHVQDALHLSNGLQIYLENKDNDIQDPIKLIGSKYDASSQPEYNQPYLTLGYSNNTGNAGLGINWWELIPTGRINSSYSYMSAHGTDGEDGLTVSWYSWPGWYGGRKAPSIVYKGKDGSLKNGGFVFYPGGEVCFWQGDFRSNFRWSGIKQTD